MPTTTFPATDVLFVMAANQEYGPELRRRIAPLICGVGVVEAALGTALRLQELVAAGRKPRLVVSLGSAGSRRCETGTVWQVSSVAWRDMDASKLGFEKGVTPFTDLPAVIQLPTPIDGIPTASLSTGSAVLDGEGYTPVAADLADMETFAIVRACQRFDVPVIGLRGVSDGAAPLEGIDSWTELLGVLDGLLADAVDLLPAVLDRWPVATAAA